MKIIINSNINYKKPLFVLLKSLESTGFDKFEDVIVVISQSLSESRPRVAKISDFLSCDMEQQVTLIETSTNNFDYSALNCLSIYKEDRLVKSEGYLHLLDTVTFEHDFLDKYNNFQVDRASVITCNHPHSNICILGLDVVNNYKDNFSIELTKGEAITLEFRNVVKNNREILGITNFGNFRSIGNRIPMETIDIYQTTHPRVRMFYPEFAINKWILWGRNGDMTGNVVPN